MWLLHEKIKLKIKRQDVKNQNKNEITKFVNQIINKINNNLERFNYNVIVANIYETYNFLNKKISEKNEHINAEDYKKILSILFPIIPHFTSECLNDIKLDILQKWPSVDNADLEEEKISYVIQINGKKRAILQTNKDISEEKLLNEIKNNDRTKKIVENKAINKIFFVKNRLINILLK